MFEYEILVVGQLECNCIILWDTESKAGVVVDPGDEAKRIASKAEAHSLTIEAILLTHAHFDHLGAATELQGIWECPVYLHPDDNEMFDSLDFQTSKFRMPPIKKPAITPLADKLPLGIRFLHTPGHSPGSSTFLATSLKSPIALTGDTIFCKGVGRTDLWGGSWELLENSIRTQLYVLDSNTVIIPGHGSTSTIGSERTGNPFVRG
ncbi:MAG: MBL fold metallo-hydrolase [Holophagaceae bacterium]|nr:MBL fold metallo-hydrolase [Holophagaceae bacterium]